MEPLGDGERVEFVPWDQLRKPTGAQLSARQWVVSVAAVLGVVVLGAAWWLVDRQGPSVPEPIATTELAPIEQVATVPPSTIAPGYTEADLRGMVPGQPAGRVAAVAAEFLRAYLSDAEPALHPFGVGSKQPYVEWLSVVSTVEGSTPDQSIVTMRVGLLELGDAPRRLPVAEYDVVVSDKQGRTIVGIPVRRDVETAPDIAVDSRSLSEVPPEVLATAPVAAGEEVLGGWTDGGDWYVLVRDRHGTPVAIEVMQP